MAIDTVKIESPPLKKDVISSIKNRCILRQGIDLRRGSIMYEITTAELSGSYDSRIAIRINKHINGIEDLYTVTVECSIHKLILGTNVIGGPCRFKKAVKWLISFIEKELCVSLPFYSEWYVRRVDVAYSYFFESPDHIKSWFVSMNNIEYARRRVIKYGDNGLYFPGSTTTLKFYFKGDDFRKHDKKRLMQYKDRSYVYEIERIADSFMRVEVEVKARKLKYDFEKLPKVKEITYKYLERIYYIEVEKVVKEVKHEMKTVRETDLVLARLIEMYGSAQGSAVFATWTRLNIFGEKKTRTGMPKSTYYFHRKKLIDASISWNGTDMRLVETNVIDIDFTLNSSNLVEYEDDQIKKLLDAI